MITLTMKVNVQIDGGKDAVLLTWVCLLMDCLGAPSVVSHSSSSTA